MSSTEPQRQQQHQYFSPFRPEADNRSCRTRASENLRSVSAQVDMIGNVGGILLIIGFLLAAWCFVHSVGALLLARSHAFGPDKAVAVINS